MSNDTQSPGSDPGQASAPQGRLRLFVAIHVPDNVCASIREAQHTLRRSTQNSNIKWTGPEQWHVTMKFLGSVQSSGIEPLSVALQSVASGFPGLPLSATGIGFFPERGLPRVIWVGIQEPSDRLGPLHERIEEAVAPFTSEPPESRFEAHITLGRVKSMSRADADELRRASESESRRGLGEWAAPGFELVRSELSSQGARYTTLAHLSFTPIQPP